MTLFYLANIRLPTEKAHGVQIMKMCEAFANLGNQVVLVVPKRKNHLTEDPFAFYTVSRTFRIVRLPCLDFVRFWGSIGFWLQALVFGIVARFYVATHTNDVVYSRDPSTIAILGLLGVEALVWETHTVERGALARLAAHMSRQVVAISGGLRDHYMQSGVQKEKLIVAHDAVDLAEYTVEESKEATRDTLGLPRDKRIVEYVGKFRTMGHTKGVEEIIHAAGRVARDFPGTLLLVVGLETYDVPLAQKAAEAAGLNADQYRFVGHVPRIMVPKYLHAADALVMNYPNTHHYAHIMSPLKVFEYMASGVPIVTTDLPSLREVLRADEAYFVTPEDEEALYRGMKAALTDNEATTRGTRARAHAKEYSWSARAEHILKRV